MVRTGLVIVALAVMAVGVYAAGMPAIEKLLPVKGDVKGFAPMADSLTYGKGADISKIYDGGYELYTKHGAIDAARQMYQRGKDYVEVTVHTMKSNKAALDFLKYWAKERGGKLITSRTHSGFTVTKPGVMGYYAFDKYFLTISAYSPAAKSADVDAFAQASWKKVH